MLLSASKFLPSAVAIQDQTGPLVDGTSPASPTWKSYFRTRVISTKIFPGGTCLALPPCSACSMMPVLSTRRYAVLRGSIPKQTKVRCLTARRAQYHRKRAVCTSYILRNWFWFRLPRQYSNHIASNIFVELLSLSVPTLLLFSPSLFNNLSHGI